jgi:hypothetical protein
MKRIALAIALLACASSPFAQTVDVPKPKCEPKPEYPGRLALQIESRRRLFEREVKAYKDCMTAYVEDRKAASTANLAAGNDAVEEYNTTMKKINAEVAAARDQ